MRAGTVAGRVPEIDGLRGLAILLVLVWHYLAGSIRVEPGSLPAYFLVPLRLTWTGVDLFFALSGFLIGGILLDVRQSPTYFKTFYLRRAARIVPLYCALLFAFFAARSLCARGMFECFFAGTAPTMVYFAFGQNFWMNATNTSAVNALSVTWSLAVEEQFYLSLPLLVRTMSRRTLAFVVLAFIVAAPLVRRELSEVGAYVLVIARTDALGLGVLIAIIQRSRLWEPLRKRRWMVDAALGIAALGMLDLTLHPHRSARLTLIALFYSLLLLAVLIRPAESWPVRLFASKWLGVLGIRCYGLYLFHIPILMICHRLILGRADSYPAITSWRDAGVSLFALAGTFLCATLSWRYLERPLVKGSHAWRY